jgi:hypothetical protein
VFRRLVTAPCELGLGRAGQYRDEQQQWRRLAPPTAFHPNT